MPVIRNNSATNSATLTGVYVGSISNTGQSQSVSSIQQVAGLVPLFPCCDSKDAAGGFSFGSFESTGCAGTTTLDINLGGVDLGTFTFSPSDTNSTIQAAIQALLPSGWNCIVNGTPVLHNCIITAPLGSGASGNSALVVTKTNTGCGGVFKYSDISGGVSAGSDCKNCDCREGKYGADSISDDRDFILPVFAEVSCADSYHNDSNSWLLKYPSSYDPILNGDYKIQEFSGGVWTTIATLTDNSYGTGYNNNFFSGDNCNPKMTAGKCDNVNYGGYKLDWNKVLETFGEGTYRFYASGSITARQTYCFRTPPFCLKTWDCIGVDGTMKFETTNIGGTFGSVTDQGVFWSLCCSKTVTDKNISQTCSNGINWYDSIRIYGYFGYENAEMTRDQIKYSTGAINKVRDEAIKTFMARTSQLPMWFHRRFYAYALMSDYLYVSDYNLNNDSYEYKHFWVIADGNYQIKHNNSTRYPKAIDFKFKEGQQFVFRDRCCASNVTSNINPGGTGGNGNPVGPPDTTRLFADLTPHLWSNGHQSAFP